MANKLIREFGQIALPAHIRDLMASIREQFTDLAVWLDEMLPASAGLTVTLRQLLEAKDTAIRTAIFEEAAA